MTNEVDGKINNLKNNQGVNWWCGVFQKYFWKCIGLMILASIHDKNGCMNLTMGGVYVFPINIDGTLGKVLDLI